MLYVSSIIEKLRSHVPKYLSKKLHFNSIFREPLVTCECSSTSLPEGNSFNRFIRQYNTLRYSNMNSNLLFRRYLVLDTSSGCGLRLLHLRQMSSSASIELLDTSSGFGLRLLHLRQMSSSASIELKTDRDVVRFSFGKETEKGGGAQGKVQKVWKRRKGSKKAKLNELRFFRLKAKRKMKSPNPETRIRYKLEKAKRKEEWLLEKLRKYEVPKAAAETYDPEILTEEERFYIKRTGEKKKNYVPVGRRGVFGGVVLNMHLHWKKHETVKVSCKPCKPGQVHEYAAELVRLSRGIVIDIKPDNTILFYRGKNYVRPDVMSPTDTLSKAKALEKYKYEQSLEHTSEFIERLENELEMYHKHLERYKSKKQNAPCNSDVDG